MLENTEMKKFVFHKLPEKNPLVVDKLDMAKVHWNNVFSKA